MGTIDLAHFLISVVAAMFSGVFIGIERQIKDKNAGLKTNALVAVGACIFVNISQLYIDQPGVDNSRVLSQIIVGVGFLGSGVILQRNQGISGLATAASIWCSAGLGCLAALKQYLPLLAATIIIVGINIVLGYLNRRIKNSSPSNEE